MAEDVAHDMPYIQIRWEGKKGEKNMERDRKTTGVLVVAVALVVAVVVAVAVALALAFAARKWGLFLNSQKFFKNITLEFPTR